MHITTPRKNVQFLSPFVDSYVDLGVFFMVATGFEKVSVDTDEAMVGSSFSFEFFRNCLLEDSKMTKFTLTQ